MDRYSISTLEKLSGIKAHTLRVWEQRYQILEPKRTDTNIRYYDDEQLKKLLNIVTLLNNGYRISIISQLTKDELIQKVTSIVNKMTKEEGVVLGIVNKLISAGLTLDSKSFENVFAKVKRNYNNEHIYTKVFQPMLVRVGLMWSKNKMSPAQEHFLSHLVRQKLMVAIDNLPISENKEERWLLFLPPDEYHDVGLLFAYFLLRKHNKSVIYLGCDVPINDVETVGKSFKPTHCLFFFVKNISPNLGQKYLKAIQKALPKAQLLLSGTSNFLDKKELGERLIRLEKPDSLKPYYLN